MLMILLVHKVTNIIFEYFCPLRQDDAIDAFRNTFEVVEQQFEDTDED